MNDLFDSVIAIGTTNKKTASYKGESKRVSRNNDTASYYFNRKDCCTFVFRQPVDFFVSASFRFVPTVFPNFLPSWCSILSLFRWPAEIQK